MKIVDSGYGFRWVRVATCRGEPGYSSGGRQRERPTPVPGIVFRVAGGSTRGRGGGLICSPIVTVAVIFGFVVFRVPCVVVVVRLDLYVVENHAEDVGANIQQLLLGATHDRTRASATMDHENDPIDKGRQDRSVGERNCRR